MCMRHVCAAAVPVARARAVVWWFVRVARACLLPQLLDVGSFRSSLKEGTFKQYMRVTAWFLRHRFGIESLDDVDAMQSITPADVQCWLDEASYDPRRMSTNRMNIRIIRCVFNRYWKWEGGCRKTVLMTVSFSNPKGRARDRRDSMVTTRVRKACEFVPVYARQHPDYQLHYRGVWEKYLLECNAHSDKINNIRYYISVVYKVFFRGVTGYRDPRTFTVEEVAKRVWDMTTGFGGDSNTRVSRCIHIVRVMGSVWRKVFGYTGVGAEGAGILSLIHTSYAGGVDAMIERGDAKSHQGVMLQGMAFRHCFSDPEIAQLIRCDDPRVKLRDLCVIRVMVDTGLRRRAVSRMTLSGVLDTDRIAIKDVCAVKEKNGVTRSFSLGVLTKVVLTRYITDVVKPIGCGVNQWIFPSRKNASMHTATRNLHHRSLWCTPFVGTDRTRSCMSRYTRPVGQTRPRSRLHRHRRERFRLTYVLQRSRVCCVQKKDGRRDTRVNERTVSTPLDRSTKVSRSTRPFQTLFPQCVHLTRVVVVHQCGDHAERVYPSFYDIVDVLDRHGHTAFADFCH